MPDGRLVRVFVKFLSYRARYFGFTHFMFAFVRHNNVVRLVELVFVVWVAICSTLCVHVRFQCRRIVVHNTLKNALWMLLACCGIQQISWNHCSVRGWQVGKHFHPSGCAYNWLCVSWSHCRARASHGSVGS